MDLKEAAKEAAKHKPGEHFMLVNLSYDKRLVLPYKDGLVLLGSLQNAQLFEQGWNNKPDRITQLPMEAITSSPLSQQDYQDVVMAGILGTTAREIKQAREDAIKAEFEANKLKTLA